MTMLTYIGGGAFQPPYPARDLTAEEVKEFGEDALLTTGLYIKAPSALSGISPKSKTADLVEKKNEKESDQ